VVAPGEREAAGAKFTRFGGLAAGILPRKDFGVLDDAPGRREAAFKPVAEREASFAVPG
jgi:hypothetical protein